MRGANVEKVSQHAEARVISDRRKSRALALAEIYTPPRFTLAALFQDFMRRLMLYCQFSVYVRKDVQLI